MNKNASGIGLFISKAICVALTLVLGVSLMTAGAFAESGCGEKCRCHSSPMDTHHSKGELIPLAAGFCNGDPMVPCDLEAGQSSALPEFILSSVGGNPSNPVGSAGNNADFLTDRHDSRAAYDFQFVRTNSQSAPLYLQNSSILI
jgi:hypothetical protein